LLKFSHGVSNGLYLDDLPVAHQILDLHVELVSGGSSRAARSLAGGTPA